MTHIIVEFFREIIKNDYVTVVIIAMLPIIELRGAIPVAFGMGIPPFLCLLVAFLGSSLVVPFLLLLLRPILAAMKKIRFINRIASAIEEVFRQKADKVLAKAEAKNKNISGEVTTRFKLLGVLAFVAVPLPMTGVWTGSAVAAFLDLKFLPALCVILIGNLIAGIIMTLLSLFFINYLDIILTVFLILVVVLLIFYAVTLIIKSMNNKESE